MKKIIKLKKQIDDLLEKEFKNVKPISLIPQDCESYEDWLYDCPIIHKTDMHGFSNFYHITDIEKHGDKEAILIAESPSDRSDVEEFYFSELSTEDKIQLLECIEKANNYEEN